VATGEGVLVGTVVTTALVIVLLTVPVAFGLSGDARLRTPNEGDHDHGDE
jgi:hypothetical protein